MRSIALVGGLVTLATALSIGKKDAQKLVTLELAEGVIKVVTEDEKWALKNEGVRFFDISAFVGEPEAPRLAPRAAPTYPTSMAHTTAVKALLPKLDKSFMQSKLQTFTEFHNRYYESELGKQSSDWLLAQIQAVIKASGSSKATAQAYPHTFIQNSGIATIPGKSSKIVVVGAHQDSINSRGEEGPALSRAPGADDNGSGAMAILDAFRVLLSDPKIAAGEADNTIEFHWYAGEEGGLKGSQEIFKAYATQTKNVVAMLNLDMAGYVQGTLDNGKKPYIAVFADKYTDRGLNDFTERVIEAYCSVPWAEDKTCGSPCSDHNSATRNGYPSTYVSESTIADSHNFLHTEQDTMDLINFDHLLEHAKLVTGFTYELAFAAL